MFVLTVLVEFTAGFNFKCDSDRSIVLPDDHDVIVPGDHMNKRH